MSRKQSQYLQEFPDSKTRLSLIKLARQLPNEVLNYIQYFVEAPRRTRKLWSGTAALYENNIEPIRSQLFYRSSNRNSLRQWTPTLEAAFVRSQRLFNQRQGISATPEQLNTQIQHHRYILRDHDDPNRRLLADYGLFRKDLRRRFRGYMEDVSNSTEAYWEIIESMRFHYIRTMFERVRIFLKRAVAATRARVLIGTIA